MAPNSGSQLPGADGMGVPGARSPWAWTGVDGAGGNHCARDSRDQILRLRRTKDIEEKAKMPTGIS